MYNKKALYYRIPLWTLASLGLLYIIVHTPLRQYLPGYLDSAKRAEVEESSMRIDSLEKASRVRDVYLENLIAILSDRTAKTAPVPFDSAAAIIQDTLMHSSVREQQFAARYEEQERFGLSAVLDEQAGKPVLFLTPLKGVLVVPENKTEVTPGADVKVDREMPVLAPLEGVVVSVSMIAGQGYQIVLQHSNDYLTIFSRMSMILVEPGQSIKAGRVIGHIGGKTANVNNIIHIEVWRKGMAVDPALVMEFE